ncbi:hypothetical protein OG304_37975 [Streptomyces sp. NBC_00160]|nr:hypothetical protein [Streptomyces sp. NBC_00160]MCX5309156.1 hypothetical protein [Streptomyces sp. NBC_00160]
MDTIGLRGLTKRYGAVVGVEGFTLGMGRGDLYRNGKAEGRAP